MIKVLKMDVDVSEINLVLFTKSLYGVIEFTQQYEWSRWREKVV